MTHDASVVREFDATDPKAVADAPAADAPSGILPAPWNTGRSCHIGDDPDGGCRVHLYENGQHVGGAFFPPEDYDDIDDFIGNFMNFDAPDNDDPSGESDDNDSASGDDIPSPGVPAAATASQDDAPLAYDPLRDFALAILDREDIRVARAFFDDLHGRAGRDDRIGHSARLLQKIADAVWTRHGCRPFSPGSLDDFALIVQAAKAVTGAAEKAWQCVDECRPYWREIGVVATAEVRHAAHMAALLRIRDDYVRQDPAKVEESTPPATSARPVRSFVITPLDPDTGGWRLALLENGVVVGGDAYVDKDDFDDAYGDARHDGERWIADAPTGHDAPVEPAMVGYPDGAPDASDEIPSAPPPPASTPDHHDRRILSISIGGHVFVLASDCVYTVGDLAAGRQPLLRTRDGTAFLTPRSAAIDFVIVDG